MKAFGLLLNKTLQNGLDKGSFCQRNSIFMREWLLRSQTANQVYQFRQSSPAIASRSRRIRVLKFRQSWRCRVSQSPESRSLRFHQSFASQSRRIDQSRQNCAWDAVHWIRWPGCSSRTAKLDGLRRSAASSSVLDERFKEEKNSQSRIKNVCSDSFVCYKIVSHPRPLCLKACIGN